MLDVTDLSVSYAAITAVTGLSLTVADGECVALLGPNGAGKTSTLKAIAGLVPHTGAVAFAGAPTARNSTARNSTARRPAARMPADRLARAGLVLVPEGRRLFAELTVHENLQVGTTARGGRTPTYDLDAVYELFPQLQALRGTRCWSLSGGEQQMVAIGRALVAAPRLLMLDEPSLGLSPRNVGVVASALRTIKATTSVLLVEQNTHVALDIADRIYVMAQGGVRMQGTSREIADDSALLDAYLGQRVAAS
ncbi:ABC transporter ATP-binding protein [Dactylosporangium sp. CS-033363]|uniref:ABC transporter ATP-binding protein n=1 Tax=Dactylosporangium sp. CS-033363 TaxID=3239935 RepID=UPI003D8EB3FA